VRSAERFALLAPRLEAPLRGFYEDLRRSEARHFEDYLAWARAAAPDADVDARLQEIATREAELATSPDAEFRFHSGTPA
jgi:tRNA-(ms[2]io[6]A)-hydroxylase